ncbi:MAG TPA: hypothetical protein VNG51_01320 [Ktedonobacteraceae bacterium]|nr:hypothetical protein [Ktedonobacteraceae bacterium]
MVHLYILAVLLVSACQSLYFGWQGWRFLRRKIYCPWCWQRCHMMHRFPATWSSTICHHHERRMLAQVAARRARRLAQSVMGG